MNTTPPRAARAGGFTLIELLIVISIMALATAGVSFALRDNQQVQLEREAQRLAALLETARARSRASGVAVQWSLTEQGFQFTGLPKDSLPSQWLSPGTTITRSDLLLTLGPEPVIGPQQVTLVRPDAPGRQLRIATDGLRPFGVQADAP
ncbi:prepilin-type N-terminal cleavage/methylation domain-containing protein [Curvibacter sp. RS43]|uniref:Prepilin-type N-terminal cleavage/methylation domain-containing protein n=1 Tax=Curvibacter microcysteis TaxID=3026419 RepID=A0ABT5MBN7_9BURK|nr:MULTISPECIES: prepilin-type N-terminal cleavage/methylation domain-containing protein [unclassified Curvibacter]MDD0811490.1 prepilin-type N-terminal cleavage/methylation domain-containing protein [Curvibacter sp. RS43]MDD0813409.1 prepilin-type N-terminal cleavage/methylation domain-containing protein [Curvibacter sp. HBC28]